MAIYDPLHRSSNILFDFLDFRHYIGCFCGMFNSAFTVKFQMYALLHIYTISSALPDWVEHIFSLSCKTKLLLTQCKLSTTLLTKSQKISKSLLLLFFPTSLLTSLFLVDSKTSICHSKTFVNTCFVDFFNTLILIYILPCDMIKP